MSKRPPMQDKKKRSSTQNHLDIDRIRDGIIALKDGGYRIVIKTTNVNFSLKSEMEQNAMIFAYRNFLNAISYPVQIVIRTRALNIDHYIEKLKKIEEAQQNELLKLQTSEYIDYIKRLIEVANILDRQFFVVVPYTDTSIANATKKGKTADPSFDNAKSQLQQRADALISHLGGVGVKGRTLNTQEVIELFYDIYNPGTAQQEKFEITPSDLTSPITTFKTRKELEELEQTKSEKLT